MESNKAIVVRDLAKCYRIGAEVQHDSMASAFFHFLKSPLTNYRKFRSLYKFDQLDSGGNDNGNGSHGDILWALRDISFDVRQGEVIGIIGKNGAGKSTLLKILSRITEPTFGNARIRGNTSSLLEVGTGFHPELTGRENVYVNGTILGMSKSEVDKKFDEIVDFSGVERFIDTPVKRYSSGMNVRLAFAVAAHLEPEVLIVDEVLAVGDVSFQKKCLGKMDEVAKSGRTVLFVSHNIGAVGNLCETGLWLDNGMIRKHGKIKAVIDAYMKAVMSPNTLQNPDSWTRIGSGEATVADAVLLDVNDQPCQSYKMGETIVLELTIEIHSALKYLDTISIGIQRADTGVNILQVMNQDCGLVWENLSKGQRKIRAEIPQCMLYPGSYRIVLLLAQGTKQLDFIRGALGFEILEKRLSQRFNSFSYYSNSALVHVDSTWKEIP